MRYKCAKKHGLHSWWRCWHAWRCWSRVVQLLKWHTMRIITTTEFESFGASPHVKPILSLDRHNCTLPPKKLNPKIFLLCFTGLCEAAPSSSMRDSEVLQTLVPFTRQPAVPCKKRAREKYVFFILHCCLATLRHTLALPFPVTRPPILLGNWFPATPVKQPLATCEVFRSLSVTPTVWTLLAENEESTFFSFFFFNQRQKEGGGN